MAIKKDQSWGGQAYPYTRSDAGGMTLVDRVALELLAKVVREPHAPKYMQQLVEWAYNSAMLFVAEREKRKVGSGE